RCDPVPGLGPDQHGHHRLHLGGGHHGWQRSLFNGCGQCGHHGLGCERRTGQHRARCTEHERRHQQGHHGPEHHRRGCGQQHHDG
ncbi:Uncharacterized protein APZ42_004316, partial [Daphnia magna]